MNMPNGSESVRDPVARPGLRAVLILAASFALLCPQARAQEFTVGVGAGCSTSSIQAAITAASTGYTVRISNTATYTAQALQIQGKNLRLIGGYETCASPSPTARTTISGQGGASDSVLTIRGNSTVTLENLSLIRGDEGAEFYGGGIDYSGSGTLTLRNTALTQNYAGYGGGMSVESAGGAVVVNLESGTVVQLNTAQYSGGGIRMVGDVTLLALAPETWIANNTALGLDPGNNQPRYGNGGGVQIIAPARAYIGSPGYGNSGVIYGNSARYGGGIAIDGRLDAGANSHAALRVFSTDRDRPTRIHGNTASQTGGGIHLLPEASGLPPFPRSGALACLWDARVDDNQAQQGSAIYADTAFATLNDRSSLVYFNPAAGDPSDPFTPGCGAFPSGLGAVPCRTGLACSSLDGNSAENASAQASGATVLVQDAGILVLRRVSMQQNSGVSAIRTLDGATTWLHDLLLTGGNFTGAAIQMESTDGLRLTDSTIAGNFVGGSSVVSAAGPVEFARNIAWQPGKRVLAAGGTVAVASSFVNDLTGFPPGPEALLIAPRFVDPSNNDFSLRAASPAIDYAPAVAGADVDINAQPRDLDLPLVENTRGPRDLGAIERQSLQPLVLNGNFDLDSRLWVDLLPGASGFDDSRNFIGAANSGSLRVNTTALVAQVARVRSQCIHLPGPGVYRLNGYGLSVGSNFATRDQVGLEWQFRSDGGEACDAGTAQRSGAIAISQSTSWTSAPQPAEIVVTAGEWTINSSITLVLVVRDNSVSGTPTAIGSFDGITLEVDGLPGANDAIFYDGFE